MGLKLSRRVSESIKIGDNIIVTVRDVRGSKVIVEVEAPHSVPIVFDKTLTDGKLESVDQDRSTLSAQDRANALRGNSDHVSAHK